MPRELPVREIMTTEVVTFSPDEGIKQAMERLADAGVDAGPVVDNGEVVGMLSASDLIVQESNLHAPTVFTLLGGTFTFPSESRRIEEELHKAVGATVREVMSDEPVLIEPEANVETAATLMHDHDVSRLPVVDADGNLVGIVARGDIVRAIVEAGRT